ncbi:reverse transcriptase domain-containing protein [Tanacetum coccineum]
MTLELANREICTPIGIARDVFVSVGKFTFPADFVIVDYESDPRVPLILGRPFLRTARALIDVHGEEMILRDGNERLSLNMRHDTLSYSTQPHQESINMIDVYNVYNEEILDDLFATNHLSGNPTSSLTSHTDLTRDGNKTRTRWGPDIRTRFDRGIPELTGDGDGDGESPILKTRMGAGMSPGATMTPKEKLNIARQLAKLGVDVIEAGFPAASESDLRTIQLIAHEIGNTAKILTFIATSEIHMKYKLNMSKDEVLDKARSMVAYAKNLGCNDIEFGAEDASRSDREFLLDRILTPEWNFLPFLLRDSSWLIKLPGASSTVAISMYGFLVPSQLRLDCSSFFDGHLFAKCPYSLHLKHSTLLLS